jgi:hypothetical protein
VLADIGLDRAADQGAALVEIASSENRLGAGTRTEPSGQER